MILDLNASQRIYALACVEFVVRPFSPPVAIAEAGGLAEPHR
jgi:hypothetical protein